MDTLAIITPIFQLLLKEVRKGEKDIFYADDTHWSWKASQKIFETVRFD